MKEFLHYELLNNTIQNYLVAIGSIIFAILIKRFISKYLAGLLFNIFTKAGKKFHKQSFLDLIIVPLEQFMVLFITVIAFGNLKFPDILNFQLYKVPSRQALEAIVNAALIVTFIRLCIRIIKFIALVLQDKNELAKGHKENQLIIFFNDFLTVLLILIGGLLVLKFSFGYNIGNLLTGLSIVGAAIALATRESLENLIASFIIFFDKPFHVGDTVKVQSFTGMVEKIGLRSTRIRTDQKTYITVPNKQMVDTILDNITLRNQRKIELRLELSLSTHSTHIQQLIEMIKPILQLDDIESSAVFLSDTGKNAHLVSIDYFTTINQSITAFNSTRETINLRIIKLLEELNIELAASNISVNLKKEKLLVE